MHLPRFFSAFRSFFPLFAVKRDKNLARLIKNEVSGIGDALSTGFIYFLPADTCIILLTYRYYTCIVLYYYINFLMEIYNRIEINRIYK